MNNVPNILKRMVPLFAGIILFVSCKNDIEVVKRITSIEKYPTLEAKNVLFLQTDSGTVNIKINTPLVRDYSEAKEPYMVFPEGLHARMLDKDQTVKTEISADSVVYLKTEGKWVAYYDVEIIDQDGRIINTEYVVFDEKKGKIYSDHFTKFTEIDATIYGKGFESDMNIENARILEPTGFFYVDEKQYKTED